MSEKRNYSIAFPLTDSTSCESVLLDESTTTTSTRKRWKSQQENTNSTEDVLISNGDISETTSKTTAMTEIIEINSSPENNNSMDENDPTLMVETKTDKNVRYDRQLRLWGDHGQELLESAHVCLLNATSLGTEILKSLILPGVGSFTIIDGRSISGADVGANFFLESSSIGKSRAEVARELLKVSPLFL